MYGRHHSSETLRVASQCSETAMKMNQSRRKSTSRRVIYCVLALIILLALRKVNDRMIEVEEISTNDEVVSNNIHTSKIDHSLVVARALGKTTQGRGTSILSKKQKTKISIVISHCNHPVDWIASYMGEGNYQVSDITIISKCAKEVDGVSALESSFGVSAIIKRLPNVGRCDHTYAHWIRENYSRTQEESRTSPPTGKDDSPEDLVFFVKDNNYRAKRPFPHVFATASDAGFGCVQNLPYVAKRKFLPLGLHSKMYVTQYTISEYHRLERDENSVFKSKFQNLGEWSESIGLVFPDSEYINVCYGGNFFVQKKGMLSQSEDTWTNMAISLSRGDNIEEGHFAERSWASIVAPPPLDLSMNVLSDAVNPFVHSVTNRIFGDHGRLRVLRHSDFWNVSVPLM